jgi:hypothetical protein
VGLKDDRPVDLADRTNAPTYATLNGRRLFFARLGWLVVCVLTIGLFSASIPAYYDSLVSFSDPRLDAATVRTNLETAGVSIEHYASYLLPISVASAVVWVVVGMAIFWRRSDNWIALFSSLCLITFGTFGLNEDALALGNQYPAFWLPVRLSALFGTVAMYAFVLTFPNGRFVPRWTCWAVILFAVHDVFFYLFPGSVFDIATSNPPLDFAVLAISACIAIGSQLYRYRHVSTPAERQQTKWVVFGVLAAGLGVLAFEVPISGSPFGQFAPLYALAIQAGLVGSLLLIPLSIGVAIVYDRLWDIDIVIRRTLVYGILTATLALVYFGSVALAQAIFHAFSGRVEQPQLAVVISTLVIAALFHPLRKRIKSFIDKRFYRSKYDARKTLEAFAATLSDETDLDALSDDLVRVVRRTMHPAHVSLWLRHETGAKGKQIVKQ